MASPYVRCARLFGKYDRFHDRGMCGMAKIRQRDKDSIMGALAGGVTPRQGIQFIQVGRKQETEALLSDIKNVEAGGSSFRIIDASYGGGKALPLDTRVLTDNGWVRNGDLALGDRVYTRDGTLGTITGVYPHPHEQRYVLSLTDGRKYACSGSHLWTVGVIDARTGEASESVMTTSEIKRRIDGDNDGNIIMHIPCPSPMQFPHANLDASPYEFGKFVGFACCFSENGIAESLEIDDYLNADVQQRTEFLRGIIEACGEHDNEIVTTIMTPSTKIANGVLYLVRSLGMVGMPSTDEDGKHAVSIIGYGHDDIQVNAAIEGVTIDDAYEDMQCISVDDDTHTYVIDGFCVTHNTFMLTLTKTVALKRNDLVMEVDFSPDRTLYSTSGKAQALYQELIRSLSSMTSPDGGALDELLDAIDDKVSMGDTKFLRDIRKMPYGYDAISVLAKWHQAKHPSTDAERRDALIVQDACLRWFASENTNQHKRLLGVKNSIGDDGAYDALKLIALLAHYAGYGGLIVELDECVNLYKINNSTSRDRNYEQILRMFNEARQGDAHYIGFVLAGTPEFVMDPRRGLFSYDALRSRLSTSRYASDDGTIDATAPIIDLPPMPAEALFVMLKNIVNVNALGDESKYVMNDDDIKAFLDRCSQTLGADFYKTPREIIRDFVAIVRRLDDDPSLDARTIIGQADVKPARRQSGMGVTMHKPQHGTDASGSTTPPVTARKQSDGGKPQSHTHQVRGNGNGRTRTGIQANAVDDGREEFGF